MIRQISEYFGVEMTALPNDDWDTVEHIIKKVIKSSRAEAGYNQTAGENDVRM